MVMIQCDNKWKALCHFRCPPPCSQSIKHRREVQDAPQKSPGGSNSNWEFHSVASISMFNYECWLDRMVG